ncbi:MAG: carboxypeptidase regulatory-like domain-containing protein [Planctomycetota bacterium]
MRKGLLFLAASAVVVLLALMFGDEAGRRSERSSEGPRETPATGEPAPGPRLGGEGAEREEEATATIPAIEGRVVDAGTGAPIAGAEVVALDGSQVVSRTTTGDGGRFALRGLTRGKRYAIDTIVAEYAGAGLLAIARRKPLEAKAGETVRVELLRGLSVRGRVVDNADRPLQGATVHGLAVLFTDKGMRHHSVGNHASAIRTATDAEGHFHLDRVLPTGKSYFAVTLEGYESGSFEIDGPTGALVVRLDPIPLLRGRVVGPGGRPIPGIPVGAVAGIQAQAPVVTAEDGSFVLPWKKRSEFLLVWGEGFVPRILPVSGVESRVDVRLQRCVRIRGVVKDDLDRIVEDARVRIHHYLLWRGEERGILASAFLTELTVGDASASGVTWWLLPHSGRASFPAPEATTDRVGSFALTAGGPGRIVTTLLVEKSGHVAAQPEWTTGAPELIVRLPRVATVEVAAIDAETEHALERFMVRHRRPGSSTSYGSPNAGEGKPLVLELAAGTYDLTVESRGYRPVEIDGVLLEPGARRSFAPALERE